MGRTVVVDLHQELRLKGKTQIEVACCSFRMGAGLCHETYQVTSLQGPSAGVRDQNAKVVGDPQGTSSRTGDVAQIVTIGAAPGAYAVAMRAHWWSSGGSTGTNDGGWMFDSGTIVVEDTQGQQPVTDNGSITVAFAPEEVPNPMWRAGEGEWYPGGRKVELPPRTHRITYKCDDMVNWEPPTPINQILGKRDDVALSVTWRGGLTGRIRVSLQPSNVPGAEWSVDGWTTALKSGNTLRVAPGNYTVAFRCADREPFFDPPEERPVFVVREGSVSFTVTFKPRGGETDPWMVRQESQVVRSLASVTGGVQAETTTSTGKDGVAKTSTRTVPATPVSSLFQRPTILLPVEHKEVHKTLIVTDEASAARLGLRQKQIRVVGIHGDRQHDAMAEHWLRLCSECVEAVLTIPLRPAIKPGDFVRFRGASYRVRKAEHLLGTRETRITAARQPVLREVSELVQAEKTDLGSAVIGAIRAAGKRLDNVRYGVVVDQVDWRTYEVRLHGRADTVKAVLDRSLVTDLMPGNLVLVARVTEVF